MKRTKKILAFAAATAMALTPATVFADNTSSPATGAAAGAGSVEGVVDKSVFTVTVPTVDAGTFDFILDPQDLIKDSSNAKYSGATFTGDTGLYFQSATNTYTADSKELTIVNKSSMDINVNLEVNVTSSAGVTFTEDKTFADDTTTSVYLGLINSQDAATATTPDAVKADTLKASADVTMGAVAADKFEVKYDAGTGYTYGLKADAADSDFTKMTFKLTGAANKNADWTDLKDAKPEIQVVWNITKGGAKTACMQIDGSLVYLAAGPAEADTFAEGATLTSLVVYSDGAPAGKDITSSASFTSGYIVINDSVLPSASDSVWTFKYVVDGVDYVSAYPANSLQ